MYVVDPSPLPLPNSRRYVVLYHEPPPEAARASHWDFMLEREGVLATWAVEGSPATAEPLAALQLADHRLAYLEYEGAISGGRGHVTRWDEGRYEVLTWSEDQLALVLKGEKLQGTVRLERKNTADQRTGFEFTFSAAE